MNVNEINKEFYYPCFFSWDKKLDIDNQEILQFCKRFREDNPLGIKKSNNYGWHSPYLKNDDLSDLRKEIHALVSDCFLDLNMNVNETSFIIDDMWVNINENGQSNELHDHGAAFFGTYYVKCTNKSSPLTLYADLDYSNVSRCLKDPSKKDYIDQIKITYPPEEKKLVIFFGNMPHEVEKSEETEERISIAFNIKLVPKN